MIKKHLDWGLLGLACTIFLACSSEQPIADSNSKQLIESKYPIEITLAGYGPSTSSFSQGLTLIGDHMQSKFGDDVVVRYVYNILEFGYPNAGPALMGLVEKDSLTLGYVTMSTGIPALEVAALPFLFSDNESVRAAMDGPLGQSAIESIEADSNLKILGFYENGFRHISNSIRPMHNPDDMTGLKIRVLAIEKWPLELIGAAPVVTPLPAVVPGLASGELHGQENPFENVVTYGMYHHQKYYTKTYHSYLSRPIFVNKKAFESWPEEFQNEFQFAVKNAIALQRNLHDQAEIDAEKIITASGGEISELSEKERNLFVEAVTPMYQQAQATYSPELLSLVGL